MELEHGTALPALAKRFVVVAPQTDHGWDQAEVPDLFGPSDAGLLIVSKTQRPPVT